MIAAHAPGARRRPVLWTAVSLVLLGLVAGAVVAGVTPRMYTATAAEYLSEQAAAPVADVARPASFVQSRTRSYADLATRPIVLLPVIHRLRLGISAEQLADRVSAEVEPDTVVVRISVVDRSPTRAAEVANAVAAQLTTVVHSISPTTGAGSKVRLTVVQRAVIPAAPSTPNPAIQVAVGGLAGLLAALLMMTGRTLLRRRPPSGGGFAAPSMFGPLRG